MSHEDSVFWSYIHPEDRPEALEEEDEGDESMAGGSDSGDSEESATDASEGEKESGEEDSDAVSVTDPEFDQFWL